MATVCVDEYSIDYFNKQLEKHNRTSKKLRTRRNPGFYLHDNLKRQIDYYIKNINQDWDFTILICGEGEVRVGKSFLACQIGAYWTSEVNRLLEADIPFNLEENYVFDGRKLIEKGNKLGIAHPYSVLIFDEAGADLEGTKAMLATTREVKDYLRECGQYNMLTILVLPEFFDLPKGIAISRATCLINVYYFADEEGYFQRGFFKYYNRPSKKKLYLKGKKNLDYEAAKYNFYGNFDRVFPLDLEKYKEIKRKALRKRGSTTMDKKLLQRNIAWYLLVSEFGVNMTELARRTTNMGAYTINQTISEALKGFGAIEEIMKKNAE